jgi:hypothetical protein
MRRYLVNAPQSVCALYHPDLLKIAVEGLVG